MKTKNLLATMFAIATICLFSCERPTTEINPTVNDSTKVIHDSIVSNPDTIEYKEQRHVSSVYLINNLDKPIDLEMHHDSLPLPLQEELLWYRNAGVQNFTLQPNDTVYCDSVVYIQVENVIYFMFPGESSYNMFIDSYFFAKVNYNNHQYEYTNKDDIKELLHSQNYWYIVFDEEKKNNLGWE